MSRERGGGDNRLYLREGGRVEEGRGGRGGGRCCDHASVEIINREGVFWCLMNPIKCYLSGEYNRGYGVLTYFDFKAF